METKKSNVKKIRLVRKSETVSATTLEVNVASEAVSLVPRKKPPVETPFTRQMRDYFANARKLPSVAERPGVVIKTEEFMGEMLQRQSQYTVERSSWIVATDNVTKPVCNYFHQHAPRVSSVMPLKTDHFDLTSGQVAASFFLAFGVSEKTSFLYTIDKSKVKAALQGRNEKGEITESHMKHVVEKVENLKELTFGYACDPKHHPGGIKMACMPTGTGKTVVCTAAAIAYLLTEKGRKRALSVIKHVEHDPRTGMRFESDVVSSENEKKNFAPLVIVFAPAHLMNNWVNTVCAFKTEVRRLHSEGVYLKGDVRVWIGTPKNEAYSIKKVAQDQVETIWIVPATLASFNILYEHNDIGFSCMIGDEMISSFAKQNMQPPSPSGLIIVAQATMQALKKFLDSTNTFLGKCFGKGSLMDNEELDRFLKHGHMTDIKIALKQGAKMVMCMMPDVLLQACATQAVEHMPKGVCFYNLKAEGASIYESFASGSLTKAENMDLEVLARTHLIKVVRSIRSSITLTDFSFITVDENNGDIIIDFKGMVRTGCEAFKRANAYDVLGLKHEHWMQYSSMNARFQEAVKAAQKKRRYETHPDKHHGKEKEATLEFQKVETAANTLLSSAKKFDEDMRIQSSDADQISFESKMNGVMKLSTCTTKGCSGGKMAFSSNSKTCVACGNKSSTKTHVSLESLQGGETSFETSRKELLKEVISKCLNDHKRILMFCNVFEKSFFDDFDCDLVSLVSENSNGEDSKKRKRALDGKQKAKLVDKYCKEPTREEKPMILIVGEKELVGTDFHGTEALIVYGYLDESYQKQLYGRVLRMNKKIKTSRERKLVNLYKIA